MTPKFHRSLGRMERWLATRAQKAWYTHVIGWARLEGTSKSAAQLKDTIKARVLKLTELIPNLRLLLHEKSTTAPQEFWELGTLKPEDLPVEFRSTNADSEEARHGLFQNLLEELLVKEFEVLAPETNMGGAPPAHPHQNGPSKWSDFLRWKLVVLLHPTEAGTGYVDLALAFAHDIADGKSGMALVKMLLDPAQLPFSDWKSVASKSKTSEILDKSPSTHLPVDAIASNTMPRITRLLSDAFQELLIPPSFKRRWFLEDYFVGVNEPGSEKGQDVPERDSLVASPARVKVFHLPAEMTPKIMAACKKNGAKLHGVFLTAALRATTKVIEQVAEREPAKLVTGTASRKIGGTKQNSLKIRVNTPVDLRGLACGLPDETHERFPVGVYIAVANTDHVLPYPAPKESSTDSFWAQAKENAGLVAESASTAPHLLGIMSFIGDSKDWHKFQAGNRQGYPGGRMETLMVSNVRSWKMKVGLDHGWEVAAAGFTQDNELTGALLDLDVATVNGVISGALNWRDGVGSIDEKHGDATSWIKWFREEIESIIV